MLLHFDVNYLQPRYHFVSFFFFLILSFVTFSKQYKDSSVEIDYHFFLDI